MRGHLSWSSRIATFARVGLLVTIFAEAQNFAHAGTSYLDSWQDLIPRGESLGGVAAGNGQIVALGGNEELLTATNSGNWDRGILPAAYFVSDAVYGNGRFLAIGGVGGPTNQVGLAMTSTNGFDWTTNVTGPSWLAGCAFGNGMFVAVGNSTLLSSPDGVNWTSRVSTNVLGIYGVDFVGDHFLAIGRAGLMMTSLDGIHWSAPTTDGGTDLYAAASGNGTTVIVGDYERIKIISATNSSEHPAVDDVKFHDVAYGNGRFVAVGTVFAFGIIYTSTNGFDWDYTIFGETYMLNRIVFPNGEFIVVGEHGTILSSTDLPQVMPRRPCPGS